MNWIDNSYVSLLKKSLDASWQKQRVITDNISNVETPGYKAKYVTFQDELKKNIESLKDSKSNINKQLNERIENTQIRTLVTTNETARLDGNNVQIDVEELELARTQLEYQTLVRQISDQFTRLRMVIEGR